MSQNLRHQPTQVLFQEEQRFTQWWIYLAVAVVTVFTWVIFVQQVLLGKPFGDKPAPDWVVWIIFVVVGIAIPLFLLTVKLRVSVFPGYIAIRFSFFHKREVPMETVESFKAREYRPLREYGGWGIRWVPGKGVAYNMSGKTGVELTLSNGKLLMIGSQEYKKLERAIAQAKESTR